MPTPMRTNGHTRRCPRWFLRSSDLPSFQHCLMNHVRWRKTDLFRSGIQTAAQREPLRILRFSSDILSIDSNGRRTAKLKLARHPFVPDEHFMDLRLDTFCGQDISDELHRRG